MKLSADAVFVHRKRAEHIARTLLGDREVLRLEDALPLPMRTGVGVTRLQPPPPRPLVIERRARWRDIVGWLGIVAARRCSSPRWRCRSDDPALLLALVLALRGGRRALDADLHE